MSDSYTACEKTWSKIGLLDYSEFSDLVEYVNQSDDYGDCLRGEWYYSPGDVHAVEGEMCYVIYWGTFGNYNSPGASHHTYAEVFTTEEEEDYRKTLAKWEKQPEYVGE